VIHHGTPAGRGEPRRDGTRSLSCDSGFSALARSAEKVAETAPPRQLTRRGTVLAMAPASKPVTTGSRRSSAASGAFHGTTSEVLSHWYRSPSLVALSLVWPPPTCLQSVTTGNSRSCWA
jgi:hypothetical protein